MSDRERGKLILIISVTGFLYYTVWILGLPFIDDIKLKSLFYPTNAALIASATILFCFIGGLILYTLYHIKPYISQSITAKKSK